VDWPVFLAEERFSKGRLLSEGEIDGHPCYVVEWSGMGRKDTYFVQKKSLLICEWRTIEDGNLRVRHYWLDPRPEAPQDAFGGSISYCECGCRATRLSKRRHTRGCLTVRARCTSRRTSPVEFPDHHGKRRRITLFPKEKPSRTVAENLVAVVMDVQTNTRLVNPFLIRWVQGLPTPASSTSWSKSVWSSRRTTQ